ncbi:twin-arginine translocation signal domain-containing protein [Vibrio sp. S9_S30]|uniref:Acg family FMN-binding oxidoreductase n=1 Tax=Vibrio sp. S9_S30 TaxID=2720226 RepID=UPI0016819C04|nr:twin-arginine translocation signal domain-containing protein [Vibrio sp. S9_S30]MBD1558689.1 twin-arginine translocation signal domain-containing protein [Vibrio sp. S9_S30]
MDRRNFIKVIGAGAVVLAAAPVVVSHVSDSADLFRPVLTYSDLRKTLISYAMLCPNPHNIQPWKVDFEDENTILLYVDEGRLLPQTDPIHRQIHIGQGTFIESLTVAASHFAMRADVQYFPQGEYGNQVLENKPVAAIKLVPDASIQPDPLFSYLVTRQSNKTEYTNAKLTDTELNAILNVVKTNGSDLRLIQTEKYNQEMRHFLNQAMEIEEQKSARSLETIGMFRFNDDEFKQYRDGFGLPQNGVVGAKRWLAEQFFLSRESAEKDPTAFGKEGIKLTKAVTESTHHFAILVTEGNTRTDQLEVGRLYNRINLVTASMGIAQHPMSQILQEYEDMLPLQERFKQYFNVNKSHTVQMVFRLGKANPTPESPRREVSDLLM